MSLPSKELSDAALDALAARERTRVVAPLTEWHTLALQLREEGLIRGGDTWSAGRSSVHREPVAAESPARRRGGPWRRAARWGGRVAVGAALVGSGIVAGRGMTLGEEIVPMIRAAIADSGSVRVSTGSKGTQVTVTSRGFRSPAEAQATLARAQADFQRAAAYLAASDTALPIAEQSPQVYRDRLAALDDMMAASLAALRVAPADPLLNQYYLSTVGAREATLQQLRRTLPSDARLLRF